MSHAGQTQCVNILTVNYYYKMGKNPNKVDKNPNIIESFIKLIFNHYINKPIGVIR